MEIKKIAGKGLIYDGDENGFYNEFEIIVRDNEKIVIPIIIDKRLKDFQNEGNTSILNSIISTLKNIRIYNLGNDFWGYQNEDGLTTYIYENKRILIVLSKGEVNKGKFKIIVEGIFEPLLQILELYYISSGYVNKKGS